MQVYHTAAYMHAYSELSNDLRGEYNGLIEPRVSTMYVHVVSEAESINCLRWKQNPQVKMV